MKIDKFPVRMLLVHSANSGVLDGLLNENYGLVNHGMRKMSQI